MTSEFWRTEIVCLQSGHLMCEVDLEKESSPLPLHISLQRCAVCGGQPMRGDALRVKPIEPVTDPFRESRRGRKPKWMVELLA